MAACLLGWLLAGLCSAASAQPLESALAPGPLIQGHAKYENDCRNCHIPFNRAAQEGLCTDCHKDVGQDLRQRSGYHGRKEPQACRTCHTEHRGRNAKIAEFDRKAFDHRLTDFPLLDKHQPVDCVKCHVAGKRWREAALTCNGCHAKDDVHKGGLGARCEDCHTARGWKDVTFDHGKKTRFTLVERHAEAKCEACHVNGRYKDTARTCIGCHRKEDEGKGHKGQYGDKCETCHNARAWKPSVFNHDTDTRYVLRGQHRQVKCASCHTGVLYKVKTPTACVDCHAKDDKHEGTLGRRCESCHGERSWKEPPNFDHAKSRFPLTGAHVKAPCKDCHRDNLFRQTPSDCISCHRKDDQHAGTLGTDCAACHGDAAWKPVLPRFDHQRTRFPLRGAHAAPPVKCTACHATPRDYRGIATDCLSCHRKDDKHEGTLGTACADCHGETAWKPLLPRFDHQRTRFPLGGAHAAPRVKCADCHATMRDFRGIPTTCISCHRKDDKHEGTLGNDCAACHGDVSWRVERFDHRRSRFPLTGRHQVVECKGCHTTPRYRDAPRDCIGCHRKDDTHKAVFGERCENCHTDRAWTLWTFDHDRHTRYALEGRHRAIACSSCHRAPAPQGKAAAPLAMNCDSCHRKDDSHEGRFGRRCEICHAPTNWRQLKRPGSA